MGYSYTIDKPKLEDLLNASKIYWKCERQCKEKCPGRGSSEGLKPPFTLSKSHDHIPQPERAQVLKVRDEIKERALNSNDAPRSIIREALLTQSDECLANMTGKQAFRKLISRARNGKAGFGFNSKCLSQIEIL